MRAEDRHKMHKNELADWLGKSIEQAKPYTNAMLGAVLVVVLLIGAAMWWARDSAARSGRAWEDYHRASSGGEPAPSWTIVTRSIVERRMRASGGSTVCASN